MKSQVIIHGMLLHPEWLTTSPPPVENWEGEAPLVTEPYGYGKDYLS